MTTLALLVFLGAAVATQAQGHAPQTFTPEEPPHPGEQTMLNARVVAVDVANRRITVRGVDVKADGGRDESYPVAAPAASRLRELRPGTEVFLVLRGQTVVELRMPSPSAGPAGGRTGTAGSRGGVPAPSGAGRGTVSMPGMAGAAAGSSADTVPQGTTAAPRTAVTPRPAATPAPGAAPQPAVSPQPVVPGTAVPGAVGGFIVATPSPVPRGTPFPTPRPQPTPIPVGTLPPVPTPAVVTPAPVPTPVPVLVPADAPSPTPTPPPPS
ncbi:MAG TPA: hypothetical protein VMR21_15565 [Vicinamibacteria bacterium]|nr:hypothetical protein [Vicinamibacteria bacterium]